MIEIAYIAVTGMLAVAASWYRAKWKYAEQTNQWLDRDNTALNAELFGLKYGRSNAFQKLYDRSFN